MTSSRRDPNLRLTVLLHECGWTGQRLADAVNSAAGRENGLALSFDRSTVAHWLSGSRPRPVVADLITEVLSRRLGRPVSLADIGLACRETTPPGELSALAEPLGEVIRLTDPRVQRRTVLRATLYTVTATGLAAANAGPRRRQHDLDLPPPARPGERVGTAHVRAALLMLTMFSETDMAWGGGHTLPALSTYLSTTVTSWLHTCASPTTQGRLWSAAARLIYLAGWTCFDETWHGAGQRYYRAAVQLAAEAGDIACHAAALRGLSVQAHYTGHHTAALRLAEAAAGHARHLPHTQAAFLTGQHALAQAACGDRHAALGSLGTAERLLDRAHDCPVIGGYHSSALAHQRAEVLAATGDQAGAIRALDQSLRHRPRTERRAHAVTAARLADLCLRAGRLEEAASAYSSMLDDWPYLSSGRVDQAVRSMRASLRPHAHRAAVRTLLKRSATRPVWSPPPAT
ncbi:tetratricopeptide repeat protein [Actinocrispum wychmicini]|uniref:tetratricopeptide repeat protein n=1 Tax=Actinocrispum wychmicini TaxID=1213861 RepID=UPI001043A5FD|nr:tetratricopeptide repeat protein [Actinocrispum wychmicini]